METDTNTNIKLVTLEQLIKSNLRSNAKIAAVTKKVESVDVSGIRKIEDSMYQLPTPTTYSKAAAVNMADATVGTLLNDTALAALTPAGTDDAGSSQYDFLINGVKTGTCTKNTKLSDILDGINSSAEAGVSARYDAEAGKFVFAAKTLGRDTKIEMGEGLADTLFGPPEDNRTFAEVYGFGWLKDGETEKIIVRFDGFEITFGVTNQMTVQEVARKIESYGMGFVTASYNKYLGKIEARDGGVVQDFTILDELGYSREPVETPDFYQYGQNAVFSAIEVNGDTVPVVGRKVKITVPTRTSQLENNSKFQTEAQVAAAVAGASHLKRKKVASVNDIDPAAEGADQYIYMVPKAGAKNGDKYDEYMVLDGAVEKVGDWAVDLSGFQAAEEGKGLSSNDYTDADKAKLDGITFATDEEVSAALEEIFGPEASEVSGE